MSCQSKCRLLNELANPLGYRYIPSQDIFTNTPDAWQKAYGYGSIYDRMAPLSGMIFDCCPVYFDYAGKTWRIEFWKGQYGVNTGAEIGVYYADTIIPRSEWDTTIFTAADEHESPEMRMELFCRETSVAAVGGSRWWLTIFSVGQFSNPEDLSLDIAIRFPDFEMRNAFIDALYTAGYSMESIRLGLYCTDIYFTFPLYCEKTCFPKNIYCRYVQWKNKLSCRLYCFVTRPFRCTDDKLLYLYYYLPFAFRRLLRMKRFCKTGHRKKKKERIL